LLEQPRNTESGLNAKQFIVAQLATNTCRSKYALKTILNIVMHAKIAKNIQQQVETKRLLRVHTKKSKHEKTRRLFHGQMKKLEAHEEPIRL
jgi:hypothetical protein